MSNDSSPDDVTHITDESDVRWTYLGSFVASIILVTFILLISAGALGYANLDAISAGWFYLTWLVVLTATGWVFGIDLVKEYGNYKQR